MELLLLLVVGKVMNGPNLCQIDYITNGQLYTIEQKCQENGTLLNESVGTPPSIKYLNP
jgi:hypothetical protein